jgi:hypothetical protein
LAFAVALVLLLFGDVIFLGTSLAPLDYDQGLLAQPGARPAPRSLLPERRGRKILDGQGDLWSGSAQFEPAVKFMAFCLRSGESSYWDPYTATGSLGPETLADLKFAPVTLVTALFGGSATALSFVLVGLFVLSAYSVLRTFTSDMGLSLEAALAAGTLFFLNGFALANFDLAIGQPYFLAPIVLHAMLAFTNRQTSGNAFLAIAANLLLLSTTFTPTAVLALLVVYGITLSFGLTQLPHQKLRFVAISLAIPSVSLLLLGFMYLPILDAYSTYLQTISDYNARRTPGISLINLLSLFTPKHFWESYFAMRLPATAPAGSYYDRTFHLGLIGPLIAVHSLSRLTRRTAPVLITMVAFFSASVGQIFGIFPFTLIDSLPFFSFVRNDYWFCMVCLSLMVMVAYGYDAISDTNAFSYPCVLIVAVIVCSFFFLYHYLGLYGHFGTALRTWPKRYVLIFWVILAMASILLVLTRNSRLTKWTKPLLLLCLLAEGIYYMNGLRPHRSGKDVNLPEAIVWLKAEVDGHPGSRILNVGRSGVFPNWGSALQIPQLGLLSQFWAPWYEAFFHRYIGSDLYLSLGSSPSTTTYAFSDASLSLAGVRYVVVDIANEQAAARLGGLGYQVIHQDPLLRIFENPHALPRSFAVRDVRTFDGLPSDAGISVFESAATTDRVLLSEVKEFGIPVDVPAKTVASGPDLANALQVTAYHHDRIQVRCNLKDAALIVLTDSWNPRWSATIDRKPAYIGKVDVAFRGVAVAAGQHEIEFRYYPPSRLWGQVMSGATLIGLLVGLLYWSKIH